MILELFLFACEPRNIGLAVTTKGFSSIWVQVGSTTNLCKPYYFGLSFRRGPYPRETYNMAYYTSQLDYWKCPLFISIIECIDLSHLRIKALIWMKRSTFWIYKKTNNLNIEKVSKKKNLKKKIMKEMICR